MSVDNRTLESLFESCSRNKPGYIDKEEFRVLSKDLYLTPGEYKTLLNELGFDQVGNISKREFLRAFRQGCRSSKLKRQGSRVTMETRGRLESANVRATTGWENFLGEMGIEFYLMSRRRYSSDLLYLQFINKMCTVWSVFINGLQKIAGDKLSD